MYEYVTAGMAAAQCVRESHTVSGVTDTPIILNSIDSITVYKLYNSIHWDKIRHFFDTAVAVNLEKGLIKEDDDFISHAHLYSVCNRNLRELGYEMDVDLGEEHAVRLYGQEIELYVNYWDAYTIMNLKKSKRKTNLLFVSRMLACFGYTVFDSKDWCDNEYDNWQDENGNVEDEDDEDRPNMYYEIRDTIPFCNKVKKEMQAPIMKPYSNIKKWYSHTVGNDHDSLLIDIVLYLWERDFNINDLDTKDSRGGSSDHMYLHDSFIITPFDDSLIEQYNDHQMQMYQNGGPRAQVQQVYCDGKKTSTTNIHLIHLFEAISHYNIQQAQFNYNGSKFDEIKSFGSAVSICLNRPIKFICGDGKCRREWSIGPESTDKKEVVIRAYWPVSRNGEPSHIKWDDSK